MLDFPTAWAIQKAEGPALDHHPRCSSVPGWDPLSGPGFLCDCGAIVRRWEEKRAIIAGPGWAEQEHGG